jgi:phosphatidylglycerophosphate synthase
MIYKEIADLLTGLRLVLAVLLVVIAFTLGGRVLPLAGALIILGWATDTLDGPLARKSGCRRTGWLGKNDIGIDIFLSFSIVIYASASGLLHWSVTAGSIVLLLFATLVFHSYSLIVTFIGISYVIFLYMALRHCIPVLLAALGWGVVTLFVSWNRIRTSLPLFFRGFKELFTGSRAEEEDESPENSKV